MSLSNIDPGIIAENVRIALTEDIGSGDVTAGLCPNKAVAARVICRETATLCGIDWFNETFRQIDDGITVEWLYKDGDMLHPNQQVCTVSGHAPGILSGERTALNFLQTLSATSTATKKLLHRLRGTDTKLLDTRKTIPGLRHAQKYAVHCAGGTNHRFGLHDAYLIKENHIAACGSIHQAVSKARGENAHLTIEVEVESLEQLEEAIASQADIAMLDNFDLGSVKQAVALGKNRIKLEVSGNIGMDNIYQYAALGVDFISAGSLTKNIIATDYSMLFSDLA